REENRRHEKDAAAVDGPGAVQGRLQGRPRESARRHHDLPDVGRQAGSPDAEAQPEIFGWHAGHAKRGGRRIAGPGIQGDGPTRTGSPKRRARGREGRYPVKYASRIRLLERHHAERRPPARPPTAAAIADSIKRLYRGVRARAGSEIAARG